MKYLCLVYSDEQLLHSLPESPKDEECMAYAESVSYTHLTLPTIYSV